MSGFDRSLSSYHPSNIASFLTGVASLPSTKSVSSVKVPPFVSAIEDIPSLITLFTFSCCFSLLTYIILPLPKLGNTFSSPYSTPSDKLVKSTIFVSIQFRNADSPIVLIELPNFIILHFTPENA